MVKKLTLKSKKPKYYIESSLSEKQMDIDFSNYIGLLNSVHKRKYRLVEADESLTGADWKIKTGIVFYMQFKVSHGLQPLNSIPASHRKNMARHEKIRIFRDKHNLKDQPTLFFDLREKAKTAKHFQHNLLKKMNEIENTNAFYVAPLTLDKNLYYKALTLSVPTRSYLFSRRILDTINFNYNDFFRVPFLLEHIAIPPHQSVKTAKHSYSYSQAGDHLCWHSGEILNESTSLSERLINIFELAEKGIIYENKFIRLIEIFREEGILNSNDFNSAANDLERMMLVGKFLKSQHNIKQYILIPNNGT